MPGCKLFKVKFIFSEIDRYGAEQARCGDAYL
jgi:hypothetical protein